MKRVATALLMLSLWIVAPLAAQTDETGILEGRVEDESANPVAIADVRIAQADGSYPGQVIADENGFFRIGFIKPGFYDITVSRLGYRTAVMRAVRVRAAQVTRVTIVAEPAPVELEALAVTAERPLVDRATQEYTTTLDAEEIDILPISRTTVDLIEFTPGARRDQIWGGSATQANAYHLDGVSVFDPGFGGEFLLPNPDWVAEFTVKGLGAGAESGGFQGGLVNIVTRSGTNTFRPRIRFNYEHRSLNATNLNAFEAGAEQDSRWELNAEVSGAFIRDKLYYYFSFQEVQSDTRVVDVANSTEDDLVFLEGPGGGTLFEERQERKLLGKLTYQATPNNLFNAMVGKDDIFTKPSGLNSFDSPEAAFNQESPAHFWNVSWLRTWNASNFSEVKVTGWSGRNDLLPLNGDLQSVQLLGGNREMFRNALYLRRRSPKHVAFTANWDWYLATGALRHHVKAGGEYALGWWDERRTRNGGLTWRPEDTDDVFDPNDPATWEFISSDWGGEINLDAKSTSAALFLQDYITVNPWLTLSLGLRLGIYRGKLTPGDGSGPQFSAVEDEAIAPRIGATFDILQDGNLIAKLHWGQYYQQMFALLFDRTVGGNVFSNIEYWDWIDPGLPDVNRRYTEAERETLFAFFGEEQLGEEVGPVVDYRQPHVNQLVAGVEWQFVPDWKVEVVYVNRRNQDIIALVDRNLDTNYTEFNDVEVFEYPSGEPVLDANGDPVVLDKILISNDDLLYVGDAPGMTPAEIAALTYEPDLVLTVAPEAERKMDQIQVSLQRVFRMWSVRGSIVWTDLRGNFFSVSGYDLPFGIGAGPFVRPNEQTNFFGDLSNYSDWEVKLQATANLPLDFRVGTYMSYFSGDHYTPTLTLDRRNHDYVASDGTFFDPDLIFGIDGESVFLEERGSRTLDGQFVVDLHVDKTFSLGPVDWVLSLDTFNLFNTDAVTWLKTSVNNQVPADPTTLFGATRFRVPARVIRLTSSLRF